MRIQQVSIEQVRQLPVLLRETIPAEYMDEYGHMNVRWYSALWGQAAGAFMASLGMNQQEMLTRNTGHWMLRNVLDFKAELREGDTVEVYGRLLGFSSKLLHNKFWMVNESAGVIAATSEALVAHADLEARRMAPFPPEVAAVLTQKREEWGRLDWDAPVSGAIQL